MQSLVSFQVGAFGVCLFAISKITKMDPPPLQFRIVSARKFERLWIHRKDRTDPVPLTIRVRWSRRGAHHLRLQTRDTLFRIVGGPRLIPGNLMLHLIKCAAPAERLIRCLILVVGGKDVGKEIAAGIGSGSTRVHGERLERSFPRHGIVGEIVLLYAPEKRAGEGRERIASSGQLLGSS